MSKPTVPQVTREQARAAVEETKPFRKLIEKRLPFSEIRRELAGAVITPHADGKGMYVHDPTPDKRWMKRLHEMQSEYKAVEHEIGQNSMLKTFPEHERETLRLEDGTTASLPGEHAERRARKLGLKPVIRWGRPRQRTVFRADGLWLDYQAEPGGELKLVRAYRLVSNGDRTSREVEVPVG